MRDTCKECQEHRVLHSFERVAEHAREEHQTAIQLSYEGRGELPESTEVQTAVLCEPCGKRWLKYE